MYSMIDRELPQSCIRIVLADDHILVRESLSALLSAQSDMTIVGEADDGQTALDLCKKFSPEVLVCDISMPVLNGVEVTMRMREECPNTKILILSMHEERAYLTRLLRAGVSGYALKRAAVSELVSAVRCVAMNSLYIDPAIADFSLDDIVAEEAAQASPSDDGLTKREREILIHLSYGFSNKEIAAKFDISVKTVETYKSRVAEKLGLRSRVDIVKYAVRNGWLQKLK
jgi:DNA-binding NarL/FixJ family response regulator